MKTYVSEEAAEKIKSFFKHIEKVDLVSSSEEEFTIKKLHGKSKRFTGTELPKEN